jgi:hypothetical protein
LPLEGMTLPTKNSFSILSNDEIVVLAADMGVTISIENFSYSRHYERFRVC